MNCREPRYIGFWILLGQLLIRGAASGCVTPRQTAQPWENALYGPEGELGWIAQPSLCQEAVTVFAGLRH